MVDDDLMVFGGSGSHRLTASICAALGIDVRRGEAMRFADDNLFVRVLENVRGRDVFLVQGFFKAPVDDLYAAPLLCDAATELELSDLVVVSPDAGFAKKARRYARRLNTPLAIADKQRLDHSGEVVVTDIIGRVKDRAALIVDDFTVSGNTLMDVAERLIADGATAVFAAVTHGLFTQDFMDRLDTSPIRRLFVTDTVDPGPMRLSAKVEIVSIAPLLAEAVRRIHTRQSISVLFDKRQTDAPPL